MTANYDDGPLTRAQAESLVAVTEPWLSCDDCFEQVDTFVDGLISDGRGPDEPLRVHLARCPACYEEAETLVSLAAEDAGLDEDDALRGFRMSVTTPS